MISILLSLLSFATSIVSQILSLLTESLSPGSALAQISEYSPIAGLINFLKTVAYITTPILVGLITLIVIKLIQLLKVTRAVVSITGPEISSTPASGGALQARWDEILQHIGSTREGEWKFAVIEADKLVDDTLRSAGYPGDTLGERLMNIESGQIQTLDGLWDAHKTRNRLVHDTNYFLRYSVAKRVIQLYEETLKELGAL